MHYKTRVTVLTVGSMLLGLLGVSLILFQGATMTMVGIVLVIASAIAFLVDVKDFLLVADRKARN